MNRGGSKFVALVLAAAALMSGCSGEGEKKREYSIPESFCGVDIDKALYEPIFPPGAEIEISTGSMEDDAEAYDGYLGPDQVCDISVDGEVVISVDALASSPNRSPFNSHGLSGYMTDHYANLHPDVDEPDMDKSEAIEYPSGEMRLWNNVAASFTECAESEPMLDYTGVSIAISLFWLDGDEDYSDILAPLIEAYTEKRIERIVPGWCEIS